MIRITYATTTTRGAILHKKGHQCTIGNLRKWYSARTAPYLLLMPYDYDISMVRYLLPWPASSITSQNNGGSWFDFLGS